MPGRVAWLSLVLLIALVFGGGLFAPFVFDDKPNLASNPALMRPWSPRAILAVPADQGHTLAGRPLATLTFAVSRMVTGSAPWSYRFGNIIIHALATLALYNVIARTLTADKQIGTTRWAGREGQIAWMGAAIWAVHPVQTASVTYIIQRVEAQAGLLAILSLWAFIRAVEKPDCRRWPVLSVGAAFAAVATKESAAVIPLLVFLYDRTFVSGTFARAWVLRRGYYCALAASWLLLAALVLASHGRGGTAGFDAGVSVESYFVTQCAVVVGYLCTIAWPVSLVFDHGIAVATLADVWPAALLLFGLGGIVLFGLVRSPRLGFIGFWFFATLAPSSSFIPIASQTAADHRLYLALAAPAVVMALMLTRWLHRSFWYAAAGVMLALASLSVARNREYATEIGLWTRTVAQRPENVRARINLALAHLEAGGVEQARRHLQRATQVDPESADAFFNLGVVLSQIGDREGARLAYQRALLLRPTFAEAANNLGSAFLDRGDWRAAADLFQRAVKSNPESADAHHNLALALLELDQNDEAERHARRALELNPQFARAAFSLGNVLVARRNLSAAREAFARAIALEPQNAEAHSNLGHVLVELNRFGEALTHYEAALRLEPALLPARRNAAAILAQLGRNREALLHLEILGRALPDDPGVQDAINRLRKQD